MSIQSRPNNRAGTIFAIVVIALVLLAALWLFLGSRGTGGPAASSRPGASPSATSESPSGEASASRTDEASPSPSGAAAGELEVTAKDFSFEAPPSVAAGVVTVSVKNSGNEDHQAQLARIADDKTLADVVAALLANEAGAFALLTFSGGRPERRLDRPLRRRRRLSQATTRCCASSRVPTACRISPRAWSRHSRSPHRRRQRRSRTATPTSP